MSASLDSLVNIVITLQSAGISAANFGTPLVVASLSSVVLAIWGPDVTRTYNKPADMLSDGFTLKDAAYKMVSAFKVGMMMLTLGNSWSVLVVSVPICTFTG